MAETRCYNCNELGHLSRDCKKPGRKPRSNLGGPRRGFFNPKGKGKGKPRPTNRDDKSWSSQGQTKRAFVLQFDESGFPSYRDADPNDQVQSHHFFMLSARPRLAGFDYFIGIAVKPGEAIVDTAAEDGVIGIAQLPDFLKALSNHGLKVDWLEDHLVRCSGVGGGAAHLGTFRAPYNIAGASGLWQVHVLQDEPTRSIPPLLPLTLCKSLGMSVDFHTEECCLKQLPGTPMRIVKPSGHRAISVCDFNSSPTWTHPTNEQETYRFLASQESAALQPSTAQCTEACHSQVEEAVPSQAVQEESPQHKQTYSTLRHVEQFPEFSLEEELESHSSEAIQQTELSLPTSSHLSFEAKGGIVGACSARMPPPQKR